MDSKTLAILRLIDHNERTSVSNAAFKFKANPVSLNKHFVQLLDQGYISKCFPENPKASYDRINYTITLKGKACLKEQRSKFWDRLCGWATLIVTIATLIVSIISLSAR